MTNKYYLVPKLIIINKIIINSFYGLDGIKQKWLQVINADIEEMKSIKRIEAPKD